MFARKTRRGRARDSRISRRTKAAAAMRGCTVDLFVASGVFGESFASFLVAALVNGSCRAFSSPTKLYPVFSAFLCAFGNEEYRWASGVALY